MEARRRPPPSSDECYRVLGLRPGAAHGEVQRAYRRLALRHHPDIAGDDPAARAEFTRITEAYRVIATLDRLRGRTRQVVGVCHRCGQPGALFLGLDRRRYCADCLLESRRRLLPAPIYKTIRCLSVMGLQGLAVANLARFIAHGEYLYGWTAAGATLASIGLLGYFVFTADVIEA